MNQVSRLQGVHYSHLGTPHAFTSIALTTLLRTEKPAVTSQPTHIGQQRAGRSKEGVGMGKQGVRDAPSREHRKTARQPNEADSFVSVGRPTCRQRAPAAGTSFRFAPTEIEPICSLKTQVHWTNARMT